MALRTYYTPQITLPTNSIGWADCEPFQRTTDYILARSYLIDGYTQRSAWYRFDKGPFPPPIFISVTPLGSNGALYSVFFNTFNGAACPTLNCNISCLTQTVIFNDPTGQDPTTNTFCIDGERPVYHFTVTFSSTGQREATPIVFNFTFSDTLNNSNELIVNSISMIRPLKPVAGVLYDKEDGRPVVHMGIGYRTMGYTDLKNDITQFKIQKSIDRGTTVLEDFTSWWNTEGVEKPIIGQRHRNKFTDRDVVSNSWVSYRTIFKNIYGETSKWSDWAHVKVL
jgi:hypothetical protein